MTRPSVGKTYGEIDYTDLSPIPCPICGSGDCDQVTLRFDGGPIVRCKGCAHVFLNPPPSQQMLDEIYDAYYESLDEPKILSQIETWFQEPEGQYQYVLRCIREKGGFAGKSVCDVGCGPGRFLKQCRDEGAVLCP